jgi:hypothetical protein
VVRETAARFGVFAGSMKFSTLDVEWAVWNKNLQIRLGRIFKEMKFTPTIRIFFFVHFLKTEFLIYFMFP